MLWFVLIGLAIASLAMARYFRLLDEIYSLALYFTSSLAALWGLAVAPSEAQISLGLLTLGGLQLQALRIKS